MPEERIAQRETYPLLGCADVETLLRTFPPRRDLCPETVIRQMEKGHRKRSAATASKYRAQGLPVPNPIGAVNLTK